MKYFYMDLLDRPTNTVLKNVKVRHEDYAAIKDRWVISIHDRYAMCPMYIGVCMWCSYVVNRITARKDWNHLKKGA